MSGLGQRGNLFQTQAGKLTGIHADELRLDDHPPGNRLTESRQTLLPIQRPAVAVFPAEQGVGFVVVGHFPGLGVVLQLLANSIGHQAQ